MTKYLDFLAVVKRSRIIRSVSPRYFWNSDTACVIVKSMDYR